MQPSPRTEGARVLEVSLFREAESRRRRRQQRPQRRRASEARAAGALAGRLGVAPECLPTAVGEAGLGAADHTAFELLPLIEVAWADGSVTREERWCVLLEGVRLGLELGTPAHARVEQWLRARPEPAVFEAWHEVAAARPARPEGAPDPGRLHEAAEAVAAASGGLLGLRRVSRLEASVLERLRLGHGAAA